MFYKNSIDLVCSATTMCIYTTKLLERNSVQEGREGKEEEEEEEEEHEVSVVACRRAPLGPTISRT